MFLFLDNFHSPQPLRRIIDPDQFGLLLLDLSPLRQINSCLATQPALRLPNADMKLIETPANNIRRSYLEQIDEGEKLDK